MFQHATCLFLPLAQTAWRRCWLCLLGGGVALLCSHAVAQDIECNVQMSPTTLAYPPMTKSALERSADASGMWTLGERTLSVTATCPKAASIALIFRDLRGSEDRFRFSNEGRLSLRMLAAQLDGRPVSLCQSAGQGGGQCERLEKQSLLLPEALVTLADGGTQQGLQLSLQLALTPEVSVQKLDLAAAATLEGAIEVGVTARER